MRDGFTALRELLLRHGVAPGHVRRYCRELEEHLADIVEELARAGHAPGEVRRLAEARLGSLEALAQPMLADRRWRSVASRMPALAYVVLPLLMEVLLAGSLAALLVGLASLDLVGRAGWLPSVLPLAPVGIGWLVVAAALARRADPFWPAIGLVAIVALGAMIDLQLVLPTPESGGGVAIALTQPDATLLVVSALGTLLPVLLTFFRRRVV